MILSSTVSNIGSAYVSVNWSHGRVGITCLFYWEPDMDQSWQGVGQHLPNEAHEWWEARALLEKVRATTHEARTHPGASLWQNMWSLSYCCCYCLEDKETSPRQPERGNKMWASTQRKPEFRRRNLEDTKALHSSTTHFSLKLGSPATELLSLSHAFLLRSAAVANPTLLSKA